MRSEQVTYEGDRQGVRPTNNKDVYHFKSFYLQPSEIGSVWEDATENVWDYTH